MGTYTYTFTLNKEYEGKVAPLTLRQGEHGQVIEGHITLDGKVFDLVGYLNARFCAVCKTRAVTEDATITNTRDGIVSYTISKNLTEQSGKAYGYFELTQQGINITTETIPITIERGD